VLISPVTLQVGSNSGRVTVTLLGGSAAGAPAGSSEGDGTWALLESVRRAGSIAKAVVGSFSELSNSAIAQEMDAKGGIREPRKIGREVL